MNGKMVIRICLLQWALNLGLLAEGNPIFYAEEEVLAPTERVAETEGWTNYDGSLEVSEGFLTIYEAFQFEDGELGGRVRIWDRVSLEEREVIDLDDFEAESRWGFTIKLDGDQLLILHGGNFESGKKPQMALYDLEGEFAERVIFRELDLDAGYGLHAERYRGDWVVWNSEESLLISEVDGEELRRWGVAFGEFVGEDFFVYDEYWLVDLRLNEALIDLRTLPGVGLGAEPTTFEVAGDLIVLRLTFRNEDETRRTSFEVYDPELGEVIWNMESSSYLNDLMWVDERFFMRLLGGGLAVYDARTGVAGESIELPEGLESYEFGYRVSAHGGVVYVSGTEKAYLYDEESLAKMGEVEPGSLFSKSLLVEIPGSGKLAWVANDSRSPLFQINSRIWNPQVLLYDVETRCFEGRMEPEDAISRSTSGLSGFPSPEFFGMEFWTMFDGRVAMSSNRMSGDGKKYQVFDPVLRVETPDAELTASVGYLEKPGYEVALERRTGNGEIEELASVSFGQGEERVVEVAASRLGRGDRLYLEEKEVMRVSTEYEFLIEDVTGDQSAGGMTALAPEAGAVILRLFEGDFSPEGTITVLNHDDASLRFSVGPRARGFGSFLAVDGEKVAVATSGLFSSDSIAVFNLMSGEELLEVPVARAFAISGDVLVRWMDGELIGHRISSDEEIFRVPVVFTIPYPSYRPSLVCGGEVAIFNHEVYDLESGALRFQLSYPDSVPEDYFGSQIVADGDLIAAVSTPQAKGYLYDATTGEILRSFELDELPDGFSNYASAFPRLAMDAEMGVIAWAVNDTSAIRTINLFEISTGERFGQVRAREVEGDPEDERTVHLAELIASGVALSDSGLWMVTGFSADGLALFDYEELRSRPLVELETEVVAQRYLKLKFQSRRGVNYRVFGGPLDDLKETDQLLWGTGEQASVLLPIPAGLDRWFGLVKPEWAPEPSIFPF